MSASDPDKLPQDGDPTVPGADQTAAPEPPRRPRKRWLMLRGALGVMIKLSLLAGIIAGGIWYLTDRPVKAPVWLRDRIAAKLVENAPGLRIRFGDMVLTVHHGWRPTVQLRDVRFRQVGKGPLMALSELDASLAFRPLLDGLVQPKTVSLSGVFVTLRRNSTGQLSLQLTSDAGAAQRQSTSLPALIEQLDGLFLRPELAALTELDLDAVTLRFEDALADRAWTIDGARLRIRRDGDELRMAADLAILGGTTSVATVEANYASRIGESTAQFGVSVRDLGAADLAALSPAFGWLAGLQAPISGAMRSAVNAGGDLLPVSATLQIGAGALQPTPQTRPIPFESAQTYVTYHPDRDEVVFDQVSIDSPWISGVAEGSARLRGLDEGRLEQMVGQFRLSGIRFAPPELYATPLMLDAMELDLRLTPEPFRVELGQMRLMDQGQVLTAEGELSAAPEGWQLALDAHMAALGGQRLLELWPEALAPKPRAWVGDNVSGGQVSDLEFAMRLAPGARPDLYLGFAFAADAVRYHKTLPQLVGVAGVASLMQDRFVVTLDRGEAFATDGGNLDAAGSAFIIPDVTVKPDTPAVIRLRTDSSITAALSVLDTEPLSLMSKAGLPVALADGRAELNGTIALPLRQKVGAEEIKYAFEGRLRDMASTVLVPERRVAAPELTVFATPKDVRIGGVGTFDDIPFDGIWSMVPGTPGSGVKAEIELSDRTVRNLNIGLPPGTVSGQGTGQLTLDLPRGAPPKFDLTSNLRGVGLNLAALGWAKPPGETGALTVAGTLGATPAVDRLALDTRGLSAEGRVSLTPAGTLERASFERVRVGGWLDAPVSLVGRGRGVAPSVAVQGGTLDMRQARFGEGGGTDSGPLSLALDRLQITDTIAVTGLTGNFTLRGGLEGQFRGLVNGAAPIEGRVVPQSGRSAFRIESTDAGKVFASAGLLKQARGGEMSLILRPVGTAGAFNGSLSIRNTRVKDAPAIAELFNALSVVGLLEQMGGQGLHFAEVEAAFRLTPERVTLTQASAVGPSIGLSMDGTYDLGTEQMDMQGVFSPIYLINGVGSVLTRKGEGLIGFNFRLSGPSAKPRVQVNPLSAFTPSIFRELFRRPPPTVQAEPGERPGSTPRVQGSTAPEQPAPSPLEHGGAER